MPNILDHYTPDQLIDGNLALQVLFTFCYVISSCYVYWNTYGGFDAVFLGIIFICSILSTYYFIRKSINRTKYGAMLAATLFLVCISLQSAIFWGQYSNCGQIGSVLISKIIPPSMNTVPSLSPSFVPNHPTDGNHPPLVMDARLLRSIPASYEKFDSQCYNIPAMKSVCTFSVFMFLSYIFQVFLLLRFKDELLGNGPLNEGYAPVSRDEVNIPSNHVPVSGLMPSSADPNMSTAPKQRYPNSADL